MILFWDFLTRTVVCVSCHLVPGMGLAKSSSLDHQAPNFIQIRKSELHNLVMNFKILKKYLKIKKGATFFSHFFISISNCAPDLKILVWCIFPKIVLYSNLSFSSLRISFHSFVPRKKTENLLLVKKYFLKV